MFHGIFAHPKETSVCKQCMCRFWVPCPVPAPAAALPNQVNAHLLQTFPVCQSRCVLAMVLMPEMGSSDLLLLVQTNG